MVDAVALVLLPRVGIACCAGGAAGPPVRGDCGSFVEPVRLIALSAFAAPPDDGVGARLLRALVPVLSFEGTRVCMLLVLAGTEPGSRIDVGLAGFGGGGMAFLSSIAPARVLTSLSDVSSLIVPTLSLSLSGDCLREKVGSRLRRFACFADAPEGGTSMSPMSSPSPRFCSFFMWCDGTSNMDIGLALLAGGRDDGRRLPEAMIDSDREWMRWPELDCSAYSHRGEDSLTKGTTRSKPLEVMFRLLTLRDPCSAVAWGEGSRQAMYCPESCFFSCIPSPSN